MNLPPAGFLPKHHRRPAAVPSPLPSDGRGEGQGEVRVHGEAGSRETPGILRAAMEVVGRRLAFPLFLLLLLFAVAAGAQTNGVSSDRVVQGRQLAQKILDQTPPTNSTVTGILQIRDKNGVRTSIPLACAIIAAGSSWECIYQASRTNQVEILRIRHSATEANRYLMETSQRALSLDQLTTAPTSAQEENPLSNAEITNPFAGSEFCPADLGLEFFHWPGQKVLKPEIHRSRGCTVLESTNPNPSAGGYSRVDSWIDNETLGIVEAYAYDANGRKLKDFYPKDFKKVGGQWQVQTLVIENLQTGARSRLEFDLKK
jgi:hypothetical protein